MSSNLPLVIKNLIRSEYTLRSEILTNICNHIDNMNSNNIIYHTIRNKLINKLNTCTITLNTNYNDSLPQYKNLEYTPDLLETKFIDTQNIKGLKSFMTIDNTLRHKIANYFKQTDSTIYELMNDIGSSSVQDIFKLKIGDNFREIMGIDSDLDDLRDFVQDNKKDLTLDNLSIKIHNSSALLDIIMKYFVPVEMNVSNKIFDNKKTTILINKYKYEKPVLSEESNKFKYEVMLDNCYKITVKCAITRNTFIIYGFFNYDVANTVVNTSQVCNNFIYHKKKLLTDYVRDNTSINKEFKDDYLANLTLGDVLSLKKNMLVDRILSDYELYVKSCNIKFKLTVNEFLKADLSKKFNILKCLLLGPKNSIKNAAMLFGMTKDQNRDSKNNRSCIADILFRNLNHSQQSRLRKSGQYIKQELERIKKMTSDDMDLKQQCIMNNNMSDYVKKCALTRLEEMKSNNSEYHKNLTYVRTIVDYPWIGENFHDKFTTIGQDIEKCRQKLKDIKGAFDKLVFGQAEFKTVIGDIVGKWFTNPNSMGKAIGLCGPPGCGKTLIASGLGKVLGIPYQEIHLGGLEDGSVLNGHSITYSGAQPGLIVTKMVMAGEPRCILFFDELDKACAKNGINEVFNVLIHATDPNTNSKFSDKFFQDVTFPLNKCIFIFSFNDPSKIDPILKDRMEIINVSPYSLADKIQITKEYLIPELLDGVGITRGSITLSTKTIEYVINKYTLEAGVRKLENYIEKIFLKVNVDRIYARGPFKHRTVFSSDKPIRITQSQVVKYLGKPKLTVEKIHLTDQIGVVNGLYATTSGSGGIIPILCYPTKNGHHKFILEMTGKQGRVMKESVNFSWTIAKNCTKAEYVEKFYKHNKGGIHVHTPEGAVPKDGPSAGSAFTTAFISRIIGLPIKRHIAMTGEISIGGNITAIGGLEHKLTGAKIAGVRLVFVCEQNLEDLKKIKETNDSLFNLINPLNNQKVTKAIDEFSKKKYSNTGDFKVIIVNSIYDIIPYALVDHKYVLSKYPNGKYDVCDVTCDQDSYLYKNDGGFNNHIEQIDDIVVDDEEDVHDDDNEDNEDDDGNDDNNKSNDKSSDSESDK